MRKRGARICLDYLAAVDTYDPPSSESDAYLALGYIKSKYHGRAFWGYGRDPDQDVWATSVVLCLHLHETRIRSLHATQKAFHPATTIVWSRRL